LRRSPLGVDGVNLHLADGAVAGQSVFHASASSPLRGRWIWFGGRSGDRSGPADWPVAGRFDPRPGETKYERDGDGGACVFAARATMSHRYIWRRLRMGWRWRGAG
jgi:hypothetical protein